MKNSQLRTKVARIFADILKEDKKTEHGHTRFIPMAHSEGVKLIEYGIYDYETKKYCLYDCYSTTIEDDLREVEEFVQ